ncbi:thioredoxin family protein [Halorubrum vacuolatum]|uniref:Thioredoxin domain-containing protein n=1 Tax=Halorubrum vacuolatum TaxID=63740 RepID=A0A238ULS8_HALVU|nr:thioredoxin family protein [Halorubrum vacuolatum]SNR22985.1 hypothetical protein SAMN06264855_10141 [Halorubrum vacuolatum]
MTLETLDPDPNLDTDAFDDDVLAALDAEAYVFHVWGGDWCIDCQEQLPAFGAALAAAGVPADRIERYAVSKVDGRKEGPGVEEYDIEFIPTVVVESPDGEEIVRFVESEDVPIATFLADRLAEIETVA